MSLSKKDIESFGFKYIEESNIYVIGNIFTRCRRFPSEVWGYFHLKYFEERDLVEIIGMTEASKYTISLFCGTINNKQELEKVLYMIGMYEST